MVIGVLLECGGNVTRAEDCGFIGYSEFDLLVMGVLVILICVWIALFAVYVLDK
jgi:hypothetical protein